MARLARLRKQRKFLLAREKEITRRGLRYLKDLDALEEKEELERERVKQKSREKTSEEAPPNPSLVLDDPALAATLADFDPSNPF